jgi:C-terminal processing protease CtpA/Prc
MNGDGLITTGKYKRLEQNFARLLQVFYKESTAYQIEFRDTKGLARAQSVKLIPVSTIPPETVKPELEFKVLDNSIAVMTIQSFGDPRDTRGLAYKEFLEDCFTTLKSKKIQSLIIDVRGNGGGRDDYGSLLFAYLTTKPYRYYDYLERKEPVYSFLKYTDQEESYKEEVRSKLSRRRDGKWVRVDSSHPCLPEQQPQANHFDGKVIVLIDGGSFSATAEFASCTSFHKRATFMGEETGGAFEGNTSGGDLNLTLPTTKLKVRIPLNKYVCAVTVRPEQVGRGIVPDKAVKQTIQGILGGRDEVMEQALLQAK